jgi:hypothetical protein
MRTTLTLDPDVASMLEAEAARLRAPFKQVVNDAIRRGLAPGPVRPSQKRFVVLPFKSQLVPGIDARGLNQLADAVEDEARLEKMAGSRRNRAP